MQSGWQITRGKKRPGQKAVREVPETRKSPHSSACKAGCTPTALWASFSTWIYKRNKMKPSNNRALCDSSHNTMCVTKEKAFVCIWLVSMNHSGHKDFHQPLHHLWRSTDVPQMPVYLPVWAGLARRHHKLYFTLHRALDLFCYYFILFYLYFLDLGRKWAKLCYWESVILPTCSLVFLQPDTMTLKGTKQKKKNTNKPNISSTAPLSQMAESNLCSNK